VVAGKRISPMGYAIQVGAFSVLENAVRLTETLQAKDLTAYYFRDHTGLYKVRFGNYPSKELAEREAESFRSAGILKDYYIVTPEEYPTARLREKAVIEVRGEIVRTAESFLGLPYRWGGSSPEDGFDCSGLTMAVYQLNGLDLPRSSREQWGTGVPVGRRELSGADLVFFATSGRGRVSHVGIYIGKNRFIHAPGKGKTIRVDSLSKRYFRRRYVGARSYL